MRERECCAGQVKAYFHNRVIEFRAIEVPPSLPACSCCHPLFTFEAELVRQCLLPYASWIVSHSCPQCLGYFKIRDDHARLVLGVSSMGINEVCVFAEFPSISVSNLSGLRHGPSRSVWCVAVFEFL